MTDPKLERARDIARLHVARSEAGPVLSLIPADEMAQLVWALRELLAATARPVRLRDTFNRPSN